MNEHLRLEEALRSLASEIEYPATPDLRVAVMERVHPVPARIGVTRSRMRPLLAAAACVAAAWIAVVTFSPAAREAVAGWMGVDGIRISTGNDDIPTELPPPAGHDLDLGQQVTASEAAESVAFDIAVPSALGEPDAYYVLRYVEEGQVSLVWEERSGLPESEQTGLGAVLTQFRGEAVPESLKKTSGTGTTVTPVLVDGAAGFFIEGAPHLLVRQASGDTRQLPPRLAGNTLLWDVGAVTYRLEAEIGLDRALEIARSLSP